MQINWPATILLNAIVLGLGGLVLWYTRRESAKAPEVLHDTLVLRPSPGTRKLVLISSIFILVFIATLTTLAWAFEEVETHVKVTASLVFLLMLTGMLLWNWRVATTIVFVSNDGVSIEYYGKPNLVLLCDVRKLVQTSHECKLVLKNGKKVDLPTGIMGFDMAVGRIRLRLRELAESPED